MLLAHEVFLLSLDPRTGRPFSSGYRLEPTLGGAVLADLLAAGRIGITPDSDGWGQRRRLVLHDPTPTGEPVLDTALETLAARAGKPVKNAINTFTGWRITKGLRDRLGDDLMTHGVLRREDRRVLGLFPWTTWRVLDPAPAEQVRGLLHAALVVGTTPSERTRALAALLWGGSLLTKVLPVDDRGTVRTRAKALAEGDPVAQAVKAAIADASSSSAG